MNQTYLNRLISVIDEVRKIHPEMPIQVLLSLLWIARRKKMGAAELAQRVDTSSPSISRHLKILNTEKPIKDKDNPPPELLIESTDPTDARRKVIRLSAKGERLVSIITEILSGET